MVYFFIAININIMSPSRSLYDLFKYTGFCLFIARACKSHGSVILDAVKAAAGPG